MPQPYMPGFAHWQMRIMHSPALGKLSVHVKRENIHCWVLVGLAAVAAMFCSILFTYLFMIVLVGLGLMADEHLGTYGLESLFGSGLALTQSLVIMASPFLLPTLVIVTSILLYYRRKRLVLSDLLYGSLALALVDETFGHEIEAQRQRRYRPNLRPVPLGNDLVSRVNHLAYFYACYLRLSKMPVDLKVPMATQSGFWVLASMLCGSICITPIGCLFIIPVALRAILIWPRVAATKQAVLEFLSGKHDAAWEATQSPLPK